MTKKDSIIHVKLEYDEAKQSKMDLLTSEIDMLNIIRAIEKYIAIRNIELNLKAKFYREMKKILMELRLLEANMPQIHIPKPRHLQPLHADEKASQVPAQMPEIKTKSEDQLERQLAEIQRKLKELSY